MLLLITLSILLAFMTALWLIQRTTGEADIVDFGWGTCVGIAAISFAIGAAGDPLRRIILATLVGAWSIRLSSYILFKRVLKGGEDGRYKSLRESWGEHAQRNFFIFFWAQAILAFVLAFPFYAITSNPVASISALEWAGILLFLLAFIGEMLSDLQLARFRENPLNKGKTCRAGLWNYSRHPNYFFEWLHWVAYTLLALSSPLWYLGVLSPFIMLYLILYVTGIPPTEEQSLKSRGDDYREYQRTTSSFIPWFKKQG